MGYCVIIGDTIPIVLERASKRNMIMIAVILMLLTFTTSSLAVN